MPRRQPSSASLRAAANAADGTPSSVRRYDSLKHSREQVKRKADVVLGAGSSAATSMRSVSVASTRSSEASMPTMPLDTASTFGGAGNSTDPAVIQAITQTMIGEFMWKDTRRNFSKEMSGNRHKRFFWLHPYTKTLYWSSMDPGGEHTAESRAKSVFISGIKIIQDENSQSPGLWNETIVLATPQREIYVTAPNKERHEVWVNALSYLIQRPSQATMSGRASIVPPDTMQTPVRTDHYDATDEFGRSSKLLPGSISLRSFGTDMSTPKAMPPLRSHTSMSTRRKSVTGKKPGTAAHDYLLRTESAGAGSTMGRIQSGIETDFQQISRSEGRMSDEIDAFEGLENVRACCNGKHDLSSLAHRHHQHVASTRPSTRRHASNDVSSTAGSYYGVPKPRAGSPSFNHASSRTPSRASTNASHESRDVHTKDAGMTPGSIKGKSYKRIPSFGIIATSRASSKKASPSGRAS